MRSMAQNRLTAVGRVRGERLADGLELRVEIRGRRVCADAQRDAHGGRHADGRRAADHHVADGVGDFLIGAAGDVAPPRAAGASDRS